MDELLIDSHEKDLARTDKYKKKRLGQYYTPFDVAELLAKFFIPLPGHNICDVGCGTGRLILSYLKLIGPERARELLTEGRIYLYDLDETALNLCVKAIRAEYGVEGIVHTRSDDFLNRSVALPEDCKILSNPPYSSYKEVGMDWEQTEVQRAMKEYYTAFMEKILLGSRASVVITPYSFISGRRFYPLRVVMDRFGGDIYSFDNVPGNIFKGKKQGIFNSNTANSVRAAITITDEGNRGYRVSPLIRFKCEEREKILDPDTLIGFLPEERQRITESTPDYYKCFPDLVPVYKRWLEYAGGHTLKELVSEGDYKLTIPTTCRYFTTGASQLHRDGKIVLSFAGHDTFCFVYCFINSSFAYWWWRLFDGGITYQRSLLFALPVLTHRLSEEDKVFFRRTAEEMIAAEGLYRITKKNVGVQENIKFPQEYRDRINRRILEVLELPAEEEVFSKVHSNRAVILYS